jgi:tetratricopeptide (TPR) repeat protein
MQDPVIIKCGHVYERAAIESRDSCITCNSKIDEITPDTATLGIIEELKKDLVLNLESFQASNPKTAQLWLSFAKSRIDQQDYKQALFYFKKAFIHTNSTPLYSKIPELYDQLKEPEKALIARLYLSLYYLREDHPKEAITTLSRYTSTNLCIKTLFIALSILGYPLPQVIQNAKNYALSLKETNPSDSCFIYRQVLAHNPNDPEAQSHLTSLS